MAVKQTIAIVGASGSMGSALAEALSHSDYRLLLMSRNKNKLSKLVTHLQKEATAEIDQVECEKEACWEADIIILAVPYRVEREVAEKISEVATQKVVISISNPYNATYDTLLTGTELSAGEELQKVLSHAKVVKAFNTVFASDLEQAAKKDHKLNVCLAGDDPGAVKTVSDIIVATGGEPNPAGALAASRRMEQSMPQLYELKMEESHNFLASWKRPLS